jgi:hypothetical protein
MCVGVMCMGKKYSLEGFKAQENSHNYEQKCKNYRDDMTRLLCYKKEDISSTAFSYFVANKGMFADIIRNAYNDVKSNGENAKSASHVMMNFLSQKGADLVSKDTAFGYIINFSRPSWALRLFGESPRLQAPGVTATSKLIMRILGEIKAEKVCGVGRLLIK